MDLRSGLHLDIRNNEMFLKKGTNTSVNKLETGKLYLVREDLSVNTSSNLTGFRYKPARGRTANGESGYYRLTLPQGLYADDGLATWFHLPAGSYAKAPPGHRWP